MDVAPLFNVMVTVALWLVALTRLEYVRRYRDRILYDLRVSDGDKLRLFRQLPSMGMMLVQFWKFDWAISLRPGGEAIEDLNELLRRIQDGRYDC